MVTVKDASDAVFSTGSVSWTAGQLRLIRQYVGPMMRGGVVLDAAVVRSVLRASEGAADDNASARFGLRVCSADGNTIRATLLAVGQHGVGTEFPTSAESRIFANSAEASAYTTLPGDRFVAEFGASDAAGTTPMAALQFGSGASGGGDMDFDEGAFFSNPWLEIAPAA